MSLQYDQTANKKPANAGRLYFNDAEFKVQQNNINNHENAQKLDVSALSAQEEVSGTECVGLLIEHWRDVASVGDEFRNFGTGVLDPTLGKMLKSFYIIDDDAAKSTESDLLSRIKREYDSLPINPFDDFGLYGGNQGIIDPALSVFGSNWIIGEDDDIYDFIRNIKDDSGNRIVLKLECIYREETIKTFKEYMSKKDKEIY